MRRLFPISLPPNQATAKQMAAKQEAIKQANYKAEHLRLTLNALPEGNVSFEQLAELIGWSYEWVRVRLTKNPERLFKMGKRYKVPHGVAEQFIRSLFG